MKLTAVRYDSLTVQIYGDVAVLQGTRIFVRREGRWQAVAMQQTSMP